MPGPIQIPQLSNGQIVSSGLFDIVDNMARAFISGTAAALTANQAYVAKIRFPRTLTVTGVQYGVASASGNADGGLYNSADGGTTLTRLASSGSTAVAGTNAIQTLTFTAPVIVTPGVDYWVALALDNAVATVARGAINSFVCFGDNRYAAKATSFALPSSISGHAAVSTMPWVAAVGT